MQRLIIQGAITAGKLAHEYGPEIAKHALIGEGIEKVKELFGNHDKEKIQNLKKEMESLAQEVNFIDQKQDIHQRAIREVALNLSGQGEQLKNLRNIMQVFQFELSDQNEKLGVLFENNEWLLDLISNNQDKYTELYANFSALDDFFKKQQRELTIELTQISKALNKLENAEEQRKKKQDFEKRITGIQNSFLFCKTLGEVFHDKNLQKIGDFGCAALQIYCAYAELTTLAAAGPLTLTAALNPIAMAAMGAIAIFSLFGKKKSRSNPEMIALIENLRIISEQILNMHTEMRELFAKDFENQRIIYQAICDGFTQLEQIVKSEIRDFRIPAMDALNRIEVGLNQLGNVLTRNHKDISLQPLRKTLSEAKGYLEKTLQTNPELKIEKITHKLNDYSKLNGEAALAIHTGAAWVPESTNNDPSSSVNQALRTINNETLSNLLGYLANYAVNYLGIELLDSIDETPLQQAQINPIVIADAQQKSAINIQLLNAARNGTAEEVRRLITAGADLEPPITQENMPNDLNSGFFGYTPLLLAIFFGKLDNVKVLLEHGANVNTQTAQNQGALYLAAHTGQTAIIKYLFSVKRREMYAQLNSTNHDGNIPLHSATYQNSIESAKLLLELGADKSLKNAQGKTPDEYAAHLEHHQLATIIRTHLSIQSKAMAQAVFNPILWLQAVEMEMKLRAEFRDYVHDENNLKIKETIRAAENQIKFIHSLRRTPSLFVKLFKDYKDALTDVEQILNKAIEEQNHAINQQISQRSNTAYSDMIDIKTNIDNVVNSFANRQPINSDILARHCHNTNGSRLLSNVKYGDVINHTSISDKLAAFILLENLALGSFQFTYDLTMPNMYDISNCLANPPPHMTTSVAINMVASIAGVNSGTNLLTIQRTFPLRGVLYDYIVPSVIHRQLGKNFGETIIPVNNIQDVIEQAKTKIKEHYLQQRKSAVQNALIQGHLSTPLNKALEKIDATLRLLNAYLVIIGFRAEDLRELNQVLWNSGKFISHWQEYITNGNYDTSLPVKNLMPDFTRISESTIKKIDASNNLRYFTDNEFLITIKLKIMELSLLLNFNLINQMTKENNGKSNDFESLQTIFMNYQENIDIWTCDKYLDEMPKQFRSGVELLLQRIKQAFTSINKLTFLFESKEIDFSLIVAELKKLNENCKRIHERLMVSENYPYGKNNFDFLTSDKLQLDEFQKQYPLIKASNDQISKHHAALFTGNSKEEKPIRVVKRNFGMK